MEIQVIRKQGYINGFLNILYEYLKDSIELILFVAVMTFKLMYFNFSIGVIYNRVIDIIYLFAVCVGTSMILGGWTLLFSKRTRVFLLIVIDTLISFVILTDLNFFRYFGNFVSASVLTYAFQVSTVKNSASSLINVKDIIYIVDIIITVFALLGLVILTKFKFNDGKIPFKKRLNNFAAVLVIGLGFIGFRTATVSADDKYSWNYEHFQFVANMDVINFHVYDAYQYSINKYKNHKPLTEAEKQEIKAWFEEHNKENAVENKYTGIAKGKNLIIVQVEALQQFVIDKKVTGKEITPNLNKLIKRSMYFDNYYYQTAQGNTSDAEFLSNVSLLPISEGSVYFKYPSNKNKSIANTLKKEGYSTSAFHGYKGSFWNRGTVYPNIGFESFYSMEQLNSKDLVGFGISDKSFLNQSLDKMKSMQQPYYSFLVTLSSHHPYEYLKDYKGLDVGKYDRTFLGNYLKSIHYADEALGEFVDRLDKEGILDNSVLVLYGDHFAMDSGHADEFGQFLGKGLKSEPEWFKQQKVPLIIHLPKDEHKGKISTLGGQLDLFPTIANLLGINKDNLMGNDLLNQSKKLIVFRNKSFTDGNVYFSGQTNTVYSLKNDKVQNSANYKDLIDKAVKKLYISDMVIEKNLMTFLDGSEKVKEDKK